MEHENNTELTCCENPEAGESGELLLLRIVCVALYEGQSMLKVPSGRAVR